MMTKLDDLSENARIVAGSSFAFPGHTSIRYQMIQSVPSAEMQAALDELVAAGIVLREDEPHGAVRYSASRAYDFAELRKNAFERTMDGSAPGIRIYIPKALAKAELDAANGATP